MKLIIIIILCFSTLTVSSETPISKTFELRYFTTDSKADGETDLKGDTEWMNLENRINFLHQYTNYASQFFNNPGLDKKLITEEEKKELIKSWKPLPHTSVRKTIQLTNWKSHGYKKGEEIKKEKSLKEWSLFPNTKLKDGKLSLTDAKVEKDFDNITWRFKLETNILLSKNASLDLILGDGRNNALEVTLDGSSISVSSKGKQTKTNLYELSDNSISHNLVVEGDIAEQSMNIYLNNVLISDFIPFADYGVKFINKINLNSTGEVEINDIFLFKHNPSNHTPRQPILSYIVLDEDFEYEYGISRWQFTDYDDSHWKNVSLPAVHGGIREAGEDLYLRHELEIDTFERATLEIETIDPAGEVWINGEVVAVTNGRHPRKIDVTSYLKPGKNLLAIRVKPYYSRHPMLHAPDDRNIGWFLGRAKLLLNSECMIQSAESYTKDLYNKNALQSNRIEIQYPRKDYFEGSLEVNYYPWYPDEGNRIASKKVDIDVRPRIENRFEIDLEIQDAALWSGGNPNLYKVEIILRDSNGVAIDDYVFTTGIRTVSQKNGELLINGKPEMLNGAQIMGMRIPLETMAKYNRCAPLESIAEEMLSIKKMGANLLRIHVHAEQDTIDGINDPRYAELADQMGIYLIWSTAGFIREGEAWNVDFEGYPKYMSQVFNHPSIVLWEASNHPNRFKYHDISDTHDYISKIYRIISERDQSRLISPTSFWQHTHYANHEGTIDKDGNPIQAVDEYYAPLMTRGSQDAYSGYGAEWSKIRTLPNKWAESVLSAKDMAYFNFEHEESAAQPNWKLHKGKPWYKIQSYEWEYEEGSIGKKLDFDDWRASQGYQAFSAWESMKKQMLVGYDGFSWCTIEGGANMGTYQKPLIDPMGYPKLAYYINRMVFQPTWAGSDNVDVVYGPNDFITPVIHHLGEEKVVDLNIILKDLEGNCIDRRILHGINLEDGRSVTKLKSFRFNKAKEGIYAIHYEISKHNN